jgi:hypothetical protein
MRRRAGRTAIGGAPKSRRARLISGGDPHVLRGAGADQALGRPYGAEKMHGQVVLTVAAIDPRTPLALIAAAAHSISAATLHRDGREEGRWSVRTYSALFKPPLDGGGVEG